MKFSEIHKVKSNTAFSHAYLVLLAEFSMMPHLIISRILHWLPYSLNICKNAGKGLTGKGITNLYCVPALPKPVTPLGIINFTANACLRRLRSCMLALMHLLVKGVAEIAKPVNYKGCPHTFVVYFITTSFHYTGAAKHGQLTSKLYWTTG